MKKIGILALQGDFEAHGARPRPRRAPSPSSCAPQPISTTVDGLVIPGGESTTMLKLLHVENLLDPLADFGRRKPDLRHLRRRHPAGRRASPIPRRRAWA